MSVGTVKWFSSERGYGMIVLDGGEDEVFVRTAAVESAGLLALANQQRVGFDLKRDRSGIFSARNIRLISRGLPIEKSSSSQSRSAWNGHLQSLRIPALVLALILGACGFVTTTGNYHWFESLSLFALCAAVLGARRVLR